MEVRNVNPRRPLTLSTATVLSAVSAGHHHGFDVMDATGLASGTVYPILRRLERDGLLKARWEEARLAQAEQRPPRRYYEVTASGQTTLEEALRRYRALARGGSVAALRPATARG
jgi:DNA-binding PadR family transcriptional regulator